MVINALDETEVKRTTCAALEQVLQLGWVASSCGSCECLEEGDYEMD